MDGSLSTVTAAYTFHGLETLSIGRDLEMLLAINERAQCDGQARVQPTNEAVDAPVPSLTL